MATNFGDIENQAVINKSPFISVLLIATNKYKLFIEPLTESIEKFLVPGLEIEVIVFADEQAAFNELSSRLAPRVKLKVIEIPSYGWPQATLLRYQIFAENWESINGKIVMYLDADTLVATEITESDFQSNSWVNGIALVQHPGYYNRNPLFNILMKFTNQGPWETNPISSARVSVFRRKTYVCGGVWMGKRTSVKNLVFELASNVNQDLEKFDYIAKFHDESHMNQWLAKYGASCLDPSWAYAPGYKNLSGIKPKIEVLTKSEDFQNIKKSQ